MIIPEEQILKPTNQPEGGRGQREDRNTDQISLVSLGLNVTMTKLLSGKCSQSLHTIDRIVP